MGEYFQWVNVDRREYISCVDFDDNRCKLFEIMWYDCMGLMALYTMLNDRWKGQRFVCLGDQTESFGDLGHPVMSQLIQEHKQWAEPGFLFDYVSEKYHDITPMFKEAERELRPEIGWIVVDGKADNPYRVDLSDPYRGLFQLHLADYRYVINDTKKEFLDRKHAQKYRDSFVNPLPMLMAYLPESDEPFMGTWIGDSLRTSDDAPREDHVDMSATYIIAL